MKPSPHLAKKLFGGLLAIVLTASLCSSANAQLLNFDFSFTNDGSIPDSPAGTVTGELIGLNSTGSSTPTDVIIFTAPSELGLTSPLHLSSYLAGSFTVATNVITGDGGGGFYAYTSDLSYTLTLGTYGNTLTTSSLLETGNTGGFAGATYTYAGVDAVPEPSTWGLLLGGLGLLAFRRARRV